MCIKHYIGLTTALKRKIQGCLVKKKWKRWLLQDRAWMAYQVFVQRLTVYNDTVMN